ncbi:MAG: ATP-binding protein [Chloroflexota bacterium]
MKPITNRYSAIIASIVVLFLASAFFQGEVDSAFKPISNYSLGLILAITIIFLGSVSFFISRGVIRKRTADLSVKNQQFEILIKDQTAKIEATTQELEDFAYSVSHDLRSPLRTIMAYTEILLSEHSENMNDEGRLFQQRVRANAERLDLFIDGILTYSGLSSQVLDRELVDMEKLTRRVISELGRKIGDRKVDFAIQSLPPAEADAEMILVVMTNLIDNAIKFTDLQQTGKIVVGFNEEDGRGIYYVKDNGIGLDLKYSETIFKTFQRLHGVDQYSGSGIGLALVKRIIARHGGRVWVEAEEGKGSVFNFTLGEYKFEQR